MKIPPHPPTPKGSFKDPEGELPKNDKGRYSFPFPKLLTALCLDVFAAPQGTAGQVSYDNGSTLSESLNAETLAFAFTQKSVPSHYTETEIVVPVVRIVPIAVSSADILWIVVPRAAAQHAVVATDLPFCCYKNCCKDEDL